MKLKNILIEACISDNLELIKLCVEHGADVTDWNNEAIRYAAANGHQHVVKYINSIIK